MLFASSTASQLVYISCVANDFMEYMECVGVISGNIIVFVCFAAIVFKRSSLFENIDKIEKHIDLSKAVSSLYFVGDLVKVNFMLEICNFQNVNV